MNDPTDLSKLSSTQIIAKIGNLYRTSQDGPMPELHALVVVFKQAVIREATAAILYIPELMPDEPISVQTVFKSLPAGLYRLVPAAYDAPPLWAGLLATPEEIAMLKKEKPRETI